MTEQERFKLAYTKGDWWAVRDGKITLWKEEVIHLLNELNEENEELKQQLKTKVVVNKQYEELQIIKKENKQLKKELFQSEKEYLYEAYAGNSVRRDNKIKALEDEFNERFGDDWR